MADKRAYAKFDVGYMDNPKLVALLDALPLAVLMHCKSILYAAQHITDGHVPPGVIRRHIGGSQADIDALIERGLWHKKGHDCDECPQPSEFEVYVHDYLQHNRSKEQYNKLAKRGREAAEARWGANQGDATSTAPSNAKRMQNPMPRREEKREESIPPTPQGGDHELFADFEAWWKLYPRKIGKGQARKAFKAALKKTDLGALTAGVEAYAASVADKETQFIAHPATWLNGERWDDDYTPPPSSRPAFDPWSASPEDYMHPEEREELERHRTSTTSPTGGGDNLPF